jgi:hypothetical protein
MAGVVPSWRVKEVLDYKDVREAMKVIENSEIARLAGQAGAEPAAEAADLPASDENPTHREDFVSLLNKAAKPTKAE